MTDNEIIKALECCANANINACDKCPFNKQCENDEQLVKYALDLINRLTTDNESLKQIIENLEKELELTWEREVLQDD